MYIIVGCFFCAWVKFLAGIAVQINDLYGVERGIEGLDELHYLLVYIFCLFSIFNFVIYNYILIFDE